MEGQSAKAYVYVLQALNSVNDLTALLVSWL